MTRETLPDRHFAVRHSRNCWSGPAGRRRPNGTLLRPGVLHLPTTSASVRTTRCLCGVLRRGRSPLAMAPVGAARQHSAVPAADAVPCLARPTFARAPPARMSVHSLFPDTAPARICEFFNPAHSTDFTACVCCTFLVAGCSERVLLGFGEEPSRMASTPHPLPRHWQQRHRPAAEAAGPGALALTVG